MTAKGNAAALAGARGAGSNTRDESSGRKFSTVEQPEHLGDRRRFLVWALMLGATSPDRLTERIVSELEDAPPSP